MIEARLRAKKLPETTSAFPEMTMETLLQALHRLPLVMWPDVLQFIEFMEYKWQNERTGVDEDQVLWQAVEAEQAYRQAHPEEAMVYKSIEELAAALEDNR